MSVSQVEVVLIDDHPLFSRGLELILGSSTDGRAAVVGRTSEAAMAVDLVRRCRPDVAVIDLAMPPPGGHNAIKAVKRAHPEVRVLALSGLTEPEAALQALRNGADGFLHKTAEPEELLHPLLALLDGHSVVPPELLRGLLAGSARPGADALDDLTDDERDLWRRVADGQSTDEIARSLIVSERTAKRLVAGLLRKLGVQNRMQAAALAGRSGLLDDGRGA